MLYIRNHHRASTKKQPAGALGTKKKKEKKNGPGVFNWGCFFRWVITFFCTALCQFWHSLASSLELCWPLDSIKVKRRQRKQMEGKGGKKENTIYQSGSGRAYRSSPNPFRQTATIQVMWSVWMQKHENVSISFSFLMISLHTYRAPIIPHIWCKRGGLCSAS